MQKRIVLFDVDGTIIDREYNLTISEKDFLRHVHRAQESGLLLGLSSDTPLHPLQILAQRLGFDGPIVAEKGGVVDLRDDSSLPVRTLPEADPFGTLREQVVTALNSEKGGRYILGSGDATAFLLWLSKLPPGQSGDIAVFTNPYRMSSFSCWIRGWVGGSWQRDVATTRRVYDTIATVGQQLGPVWEQRDVDNNPHYGVIILHHRSMRKVLGMTPIRQRFPGVPITMVGDGATDWLGDPEIDQMAVGNAVEEYRRHCSWVSPSPVTAGAVEALSEILRTQSR